VPEVPGGDTHPAQVEAVRRAGRYLSAAGYCVEEVLPPDIEEAARLWHAIGSNDVFRLLAPNIEEHGDAAARISLHEWLALYPPTGSLAALDALARRDLLLWRWLEFFNDYPIIVLPTHCDLPPPWGEDQTREGQQRFLHAVRVGLIAPLLGLAGLAVPVGVHGALRTGVQIVPSRFREGLALDAGEVIEAAEGVIATIDPAW
jgi:amidase